MKRLNWISFYLFVFFLLGCASKKPQAIPDVYGPSPKDDQAETPSPLQLELRPGQENKIALVIGGAGVASFATVGLLKQLEQEGIEVEAIVTTGWPTLFALGYGFLKSVHDLEWFAMRLQMADLKRLSTFNGEETRSTTLTALVENAFSKDDLRQTRLPVIVSAKNTEMSSPELYAQGDWKTPLLKTMSIPGLFRPYPNQSEKTDLDFLQALDVEQAIARGSSIVVAISMYEDYFQTVRHHQKSSNELLFRHLYLSHLKKNLKQQMARAHISGRIVLNRPPDDLSGKRAAILLGVQEAKRIAITLRNTK